MFDYEKENKEKLTEEQYKNLLDKQKKFSNKFLLIFMSVFGGLFLIIGIILLSLNVVDEDGTKVGIVFIGLAVFFTLIFLIIYIIQNKLSYNLSYQKYKKRIDKYGMINTYDLMMSVSIQQKQIEELENKVLELEEEINNLKNK